MFAKLRNAFLNIAKNIHETEINEVELDKILSELEILLLESDVAVEIIDLFKYDLHKKLIGIKVHKNKIYQIIQNSLTQNILSLFDSLPVVDITSRIISKNEINNNGNVFVIMFVGINGTGKTTTLAKITYLLKKLNVSTVIAASDTYRAGAIEQLQVHSNRLNTKLVHQNYGSDPASVARDAILYAKSHNVDCVLIDTAGRMQTSKNLMDQISKITNVSKPDLKIFVGDSLAGNDVVNQAQEFYNYVKFDASILTKADVDARGGAALSIMKLTSTPILYFGTGQNYDDLKQFDKTEYIHSIFPEVQTTSLINKSVENDTHNTNQLQKLEAPAVEYINDNINKNNNVDKININPTDNNELHETNNAESQKPHKLQTTKKRFFDRFRK